VNRRSQIDLSLNDLRLLLAIFETGSFTAAASELGMTQPGVSRGLARLEHRLGGSLFERDSRHHLQMTPVGARLIAYGRDALGRFDETMSKFEADTAEGELRVEASTTLSDFLVQDWIHGFSLENPGVKSFVHFSDSAAVEEDILDGTTDIGFIGRVPIHSALRYQPVAKDEVVLAVPADHPFAAHRELELEQLRNQPFITRSRSSGGVGIVSSILRGRGVAQAERNIVLRLDSAQECLRAVAQGRGFSWMSDLPFRQGEVDGVVPVRVRNYRFERQLYFVSRRHPQRPLVLAFVKWMRKSEVLADVE
jgi:DNA-binding transcriptional LysR family regulator